MGKIERITKCSFYPQESVSQSTGRKKKIITRSDNYYNILKTALAEVNEDFRKEALFENRTRLPLVGTRKKGSPAVGTRNIMRVANG